MPNEVMIAGPVFDGRANASARAYCRVTETELAEESASRIREFLPTQYKYLGHGGNPDDNPVPANAGYYESRIHAEATADGARVTDDEVVYGAWLEGTSSMNDALRFPGYGAFRLISQQMDNDAARLAEAGLPPYLALMNGV